MKYGKTGATLLLNKAEICRVEGGMARLVTDKKGKPLHLLGISEKPEQVAFKTHAGTRRMTIGPNQRIAL
jgi:hypothetical protein